MGAIGNVIPELVNSFNVYLSGNKLVGVSGEVELPELEAMTETIELAGSLGELETPATGHFSSAKIKIPFAVLHEDLFSLIDTTKPVEITLRGSMQRIITRSRLWSGVKPPQPRSGFFQKARRASRK